MSKLISIIVKNIMPIICWIIKWIETEIDYKIVDADYPRKIQLDRSYKKIGWSRPEKIESRKMEGREIVTKRVGIKNKLMNKKTGFKLKNGFILIGTKK